VAIKFQDYYETLGVARDASPEEIQKAYRRLARRYHPDLSKAAFAEDKFKRIAEAYEVLKDKDKRKRYDQLGHNWKAGQDFDPPPGFSFHFGQGGPGGVHFEEAGDFSDFFRSFFGGGGEEAFGAGNRRRRRRRGFAARGETREAAVAISLEDAHRGATKSLSLEVHEPDEQGRMRRSIRTFDVKIPAGATRGTRMRLLGQGGPGQGGGERGDLLLTIEIEPHPRFRLDGHDIATTVPIAPWEAALGAKVPLRTLDGEVTMTVPPGSSSGRQLRLRGQGLRRATTDRGDLYIELKIVVPKELSADEKALFEQLGSVSRFRPRDGAP